MRVDSSTIVASFIVALLSSFIIALGVLLVRTLTLTILQANFIVDYILNIYILFIFAAFVFLRGSYVAAWLVYRHDVPWGYKVEFKQVLPIFIIAFIMALVFYFAVHAYITTEIPYLAYLGRTGAYLQQARPL